MHQNQILVGDVLRRSAARPAGRMLLQHHVHDEAYLPFIEPLRLGDFQASTEDRRDGLPLRRANYRERDCVRAGIAESHELDLRADELVHRARAYCELDTSPARRPSASRAAAVPGSSRRGRVPDGRRATLRCSPSRYSRARSPGYFTPSSKKSCWNGTVFCTCAMTVPSSHDVAVIRSDDATSTDHVARDRFSDCPAHISMKRVSSHAHRCHSHHRFRGDDGDRRS